MVIKYEEAKKIMGNDLIGACEIEKAFSVNIDKNNIPEIPFSLEKLKQAKENNQILILRLSYTKEEKPFTIENINTFLNKRLSDGSFALFRDYNDAGERIEASLYQNEHFASEETPANSWALVGIASKETAAENPSPVEIIYDHIAYFQNTSKKLINNCEVMTSNIQDGMNIFISDFPKEDGLYVGITREYLDQPRLKKYLSITKNA